MVKRSIALLLCAGMIGALPASAAEKLSGPQDRRPSYYASPDEQAYQSAKAALKAADKADDFSLSDAFAGGFESISKSLGATAQKLSPSNNGARTYEDGRVAMTVEKGVFRVYTYQDDIGGMTVYVCDQKNKSYAIEKYSGGTHVSTQFADGSIEYYGENGVLTRKYDASSGVLYVYDNQYGSFGGLFQMDTYVDTADGPKLYSTTSYSYEDGMKTQTVYFMPKDSLSPASLLTYDCFYGGVYGVTQKDTYVLGSGGLALYSTTTYSYTDDTETRTLTYAETGLTETTVYQNGLLLSSTDTAGATTTYAYTYDKKGNLLKRIATKSDGTTTVLNYRKESATPVNFRRVLDTALKSALHPGRTFRTRTRDGRKYTFLDGVLVG